MDNSDLVGTVFLDLSKAFDLVSHDILIAKLAKYHTRQVCSVSSVPSSPARLDRGVPRGSIIGPHLFSVYMNDLPLLLEETEVDIYSDHTTFCSSGATCTEIQQTLNEDPSKANSWYKLSDHEMQPNIKKTKHLLICSAKKL